MFAACLELDTAHPLGDQLIAQARGQGLANIPHDKMAVWQHQGATLVQQWQFNDSSSVSVDLDIAGDAQTRVLFWGRIDNAQELISSLQVKNRIEAGSSGPTDAGLILLAWQYWGDQLCQHLVGDFAFAIFTAENNELFLARDQFGVKPLYVYRDESRLIVATSMAVITRLPEIELEPSATWILRYLMDCSADWRETAYAQIKRIQPTHFCRLSFGPDCADELKQQAYFDFSDIRPITLELDGQYIQQYLSLFNQAVRDRVQSDFPVATECSGGLDSSSVSVLAANWIDNPDKNLHSFATTLHEQEPEAVSLANGAYTQDSSVCLDQQALAGYDWQQIDQEHLDTVGIPVEQGFSRLHVPFYRSAKEKGCKILLSGFGGDEFSTIYGAPARYEFWDRKDYRLWASRFRGGFLGSKLRMIKWLYRLARFGPGTETAQRIISGTRQNWESEILNRDQNNFESVKAQTLKRSRYDMGCRSLNEFVLGNRLSPSISARLEACTLMAARYGLEYRWPMLDIRLVSFFLAVPSQQKLGPKGVGRYLHRRAMSGILPDALCWRDKSMGNQAAIENKNKENNKYKKININNKLNNIINVDNYNSLCEEKTDQLNRNQRWQLEKIRRLNEWLDSNESANQHAIRVKDEKNIDE